MQWTESSSARTSRSLLSTDSVGDLRRLNPYLEMSNAKNLLGAVVGLVLRANRIAQWQRCRGAEYDVRKAIGKARDSESAGHVGKLQKEIGGLVGNLGGKRYFVQSNADFDPRLLVFEYIFGWLLRNHSLTRGHIRSTSCKRCSMST